MPVLAYFGIESSGLNLVIDLLILFVVVLYLSLIYWTYADARRRIVDPMLIGCATAASLFPFVGTIVYMILRPPEYLEDVQERELETQAAEARVRQLEHELCRYCDYPIERDFVRCPSCLRKLKDRCVSCSRPLEQSWTLCPYCETEVTSAPPSRRPARRRAGAQLRSDRAEIVGAPGDGEVASETEISELAPNTAKTAAARASRRVEEDARAPLVASEPATRPRGGRASQPGGRPRPSS